MEREWAALNLRRQDSESADPRDRIFVLSKLGAGFLMALIPKGTSFPRAPLRGFELSFKILIARPRPVRSGDPWLHWPRVLNL
jgi:hypothetical protein